MVDSTKNSACGAPYEGPGDKGVERKSARFEGLRFAYAVCGGIGATEAVRCIRELRRHGASVTPFFTSSASAFITELSVSWAADRPVVTEGGWDVSFLDAFDLVLVAPTTLNTLSKIALGLSDNVVTTLAAAQLGHRRPLLLIPTYHSALGAHPACENHLTTLRGWGVHVRQTYPEEGRIKMPSPEQLVAWVQEVLPRVSHE